MLWTCMYTWFLFFRLHSWEQKCWATCLLWAALLFKMQKGYIVCSDNPLSFANLTWNLFLLLGRKPQCLECGVICNFSGAQIWIKITMRWAQRSKSLPTSAGAGGPGVWLSPGSVVLGFSVPLEGGGNDGEVIMFLFLHLRNAKEVREPPNVTKQNKNVVNLWCVGIGRRNT